MNALFGALLIWSLSVGASCGSANVQSTQPGEVRPPSTPAKDVMTLTTEHPTGSIKLESDVLKSLPEVLEVSVTKVVNPTASPVDLFVYVRAAGEENKPEPEKVLIGTFSLYPADRPAKFMLGPAPAFRKFSEIRKGSEESRLVFEMKVSENKPQVEVTIASPAWSDKKN